MFKGVFYNAVCGCMVDVLLGGLAYHGACQLKILNYNLKNLIQTTKSTQEKLIACVVRHKRILRLAFCRIIITFNAIFTSQFNFMPNFLHIKLLKHYCETFTTQVDYKVTYF